MNQIYNERIRLLATLLNNMAVGTFVTAIIVPAVGLLYGSPTAPASGAWWLIGAAWLAAGVILHIVAQAVLGRLKP